MALPPLFLCSAFGLPGKHPRVWHVVCWKAEYHPGARSGSQKREAEEAPMSQHRDKEVGLGIPFFRSCPAIPIFLFAAWELRKQLFLQPAGIRRRRPGWQG